jgi:hypothetical protein
LIRDFGRLSMHFSQLVACGRPGRVAIARVAWWRRCAPNEKQKKALMRKLIPLACAILLGGCAIIVTPDSGDVRVQSVFNSEVVVGNGMLARDERAVGSLPGLEVGGAVQVDVRVGGAPSLLVEADSNLLPLIRTVPKGDRLVITTEGSYRTSNPVHITYTVPQLTDLRVSGSGRMNVTGLNGAPLRVRQSGAGRLELAGEVSGLDVHSSGAGRLDAEQLHARNANIEASGAGRVSVGDVRGDYASVSTSGAGEVTVAGAVRSLTARVSGSGTANLERLASEQADLKTSGAGDIRARVTHNLLAQTSGAGGITVVGNPAQRNVSGKRVKVLD